jgi:hypothetical protein
MKLSGLFIATIALMLMIGGWAVGRAQSSAPDFELVVEATILEDGSISTAVDCARGCKLAWVQRGVNPKASPMPHFDFHCKGSNNCPSGTIGGWLEK